MRYRRFGRTGLEVSEIAFGGGVVGGILVDPDDERKLAALRRANEAGVNWIDTAPAYGNGKSEEAIGRLLPQTTGPWHLSTKVRLEDRKSTRLNSSHVKISYAVFCLKKKKKKTSTRQPQ